LACVTISIVSPHFLLGLDGGAVAATTTTGTASATSGAASETAAKETVEDGRQIL